MAIKIRTPATPAVPVASGDTATVDFDSTVSIPVLNNDTGNSLSIQSIDTSGTQGTATQSGSNIVYDPNNQFDSLNPQQSSTDSFNYTITDPFNQTSTATVTVTVENSALIPGLAGSRGVGGDPEGIAFNSTGSRMFIVDNADEKVVQYDLSTNFDVTTASGSGSLNINSQLERPTTVEFNNTGSRMFVTGRFFDRIYQYDLTTNFDVTTASPAGFKSFNYSPDVSPTGIAFNSTGNLMVLVDAFADGVLEFNLSGPFNISTASKTSEEIFVQNPHAVTFNDTGSRMFVVSQELNNRQVIQYNLSTPYDIATASFTNTFGIGSEDQVPNGIKFSNSGNRMFIVGSENDKVYQYNLGTPFDISTI